MDHKIGLHIDRMAAKNVVVSRWEQIVAFGRHPGKKVQGPLVSNTLKGQCFKLNLQLPLSATSLPLSANDK